MSDLSFSFFIVFFAFSQSTLVVYSFCCVSIVALEENSLEYNQSTLVVYSLGLQAGKGPFY